MRSPPSRPMDTRLRLVLPLVAAAVAVAAERNSYRGDLMLVLGDGVVGILLVTCGVIAWDRRPQSRVGILMVIAGFTWFAGNFGAIAVYLHRGPLVHLHISYPTGRLRRRLAQATVAGAYVHAVIEPVARTDVVTLALAVLVAVAALDIFLRTSGTARRAGIPALVAALTFAGVLALGAIQRLAEWDADEQVLWLYNVVVAFLILVLLIDLLRGRWADAVVSALVVDLGERSDTQTLADELGRALGDRSLVLGYWLPEESRYVDDAGRPLELPEPGSNRVVTPIPSGGQPVAVLVHDAAVLDDSGLLDSVAAAARLAVSNARLQAEVRARVLELAASRRRVIEAADAQRRRLEQELHNGAGQRLEAVTRYLASLRAHTGERASQQVADVEAELAVARKELRDFAHGVYPRALSEGGLAPALQELADRSGLPVECDISADRLPDEVEAAVYFVCSEALANVGKHAGATKATINVARMRDRLRITISDDGRGGADPSKGSGLRGLRDRVEALDGRLTVQSPDGGGTRVKATIPVHT